MKRKTILLLCLLAVLPAGCDSLGKLREDPRAELVAAAEMYTATGKVLIELKRQGQLGDDEIKDISAMLHVGSKYLEQWEAAIEAGEPNADITTAFKVILGKLIAMEKEHNGSS